MRLTAGFFLGGVHHCFTSTIINHIICRIPVLLNSRMPSQEGGEVRFPYTLPLDPALKQQTHNPSEPFLHVSMGRPSVYNSLEAPFLSVSESFGDRLIALL